MSDSTAIASPDAPDTDTSGHSFDRTPVEAPRIVQAARLVSTPHRVGDYAVERRLGKGGMSEVHLAFGPDGQRVAIKHVPAGGDPSHRSRLRREARTTARLDHPSVVKILDVVEDDDGLWLILEYVDGITLAEEVSVGSLPPTRALDIAAQIAEGLASAHEIGILHRDLKSENVMLTPDGRIRLLDFGLAKALWSDDESQTLTLHGEVMGTCRAMSPEQARGWKLDGRSDLFALGSLLYEMVTGVSPFKAKTPVATMNRVCTHEPPPAHMVEPEIPRSVSQLISHLHQKKADDRPQNAQEVADLILATRARLGAEKPGSVMTPAALWAALLVITLLGAGLLFENFGKNSGPGSGTESANPAAGVLSTPSIGRPGLDPTASAAGSISGLLGSLAEATSAADLEALRRRSLRLIEPAEALGPSRLWAESPPSPDLAQVGFVLAAIDFELAAPDAAIRWLDLSREILLAQEQALPGKAEREATLEKARQRLLGWPKASKFLPPLGLPPNCQEDPEGRNATICPPLSRRLEELEAARGDADSERLLELADEAAERGLKRMELRARLEALRLRAASPEADTGAPIAAHLEEEATSLGLNALLHRVHALRTADDLEASP